jgi:hypothetical protein
MDPDDERCKSGPIKPLNISRTLCHPYLAILVCIALCNVIMSKNGDITDLVPIKDRYMISAWLFLFRARASLVSIAFERDVYIEQVSLLFRRYGLRGSLDRLEWF